MSKLKSLILASCALLTLSGCSSLSARKTVNSPKEIAALTKALETKGPDSLIQVQVNDQTRQIEELKGYMVLLNQQFEAVELKVARLETENARLAANQKPKPKAKSKKSKKRKQR